MKSWKDRDFWEERFLEGRTPWELGGASPTLVALEEETPLPASSTVIVPGCGTGDDALHFARRGYSVSAVDWAGAAIDDLRAKARRQGVGVEALCASVWDIPESWHGTFDVWIEHTFFCAIDPAERSRYRDQVLRLLKPTGVLLGAFFVTEDPDARCVYPVEGKDEPPFWTTREELSTLFGPHFDMNTLEVSPVAHSDRKGLEWSARFQRRTSDC